MIIEATSLQALMKNNAYTTTDFHNIIAQYKTKRERHPDTHIEYVKSISSGFADVIIAATVALDAKGEKHLHQFRMSNARLRQFARKLCEHEAELIAAKNFEDIFSIVSGIRVFGLGAALYYDTSLRIAYTKPGCLPDSIYLIRGSLKAAKNLGIETKGRTFIARNELPKELASSDLNCAQLTDLLICYFAENRWSDGLEFA